MNALHSKRAPRASPAGRSARTRGGGLLLVALAALLSWSAGCSPALDEVRFHAATDLDCATAKLHVESLGETRYLVTGCEQSAQYVCTTRPCHRGSVVTCERDVEARARTGQGAGTNGEVASTPLPDGASR